MQWLPLWITSNKLCSLLLSLSQLLFVGRCTEHADNEHTQKIEMKWKNARIFFLVQIGSPLIHSKNTKNGKPQVENGTTAPKYR